MPPRRVPRRRRRSAALAAVALSAAAVRVAGDDEEGPPNLLLLFPDQWRWDWAGFDPDSADLRTPNLRRLAERGTRFTTAYTPSPWCVPARTCLASGKAFDESPKVMNGHDYPTDVKTWYTAVQQAGYHTIVVGKDDLTQSRGGTGLDGARHAKALGFSSWFRMQDKYVTYFLDTPIDQFGVNMTTRTCGLHDGGADCTSLFQCNKWCYGRFGTGNCCTPVEKQGLNCDQGFDQVGDNQESYVDNVVAARAEQLLDDVPPGKPWALHVSFPGPHPPFVLTESMNRSIAGRQFPLAVDNEEVPPAVQRTMRQQYAAEIENLDKLIGRIIQKLEARGEAGRTIVVATSDHGEQLGDHNHWGKQVPWEASVRVPLVISGPGIAENRIVDLPVSTLDVIGLFLDRSGANASGFDVQSLGPLLRADMDEKSYLRGRPFVPTGLTSAGSVRSKPVDFRSVVKQVNDTHTIKVMCCPTGCPAGNTFVGSNAPLPQLVAFNIARGDVENLNWTSEALALAQLLPGKYATACTGQSAPSPELTDSAATAAENPEAESSGSNTLAGIGWDGPVLWLSLFCLLALSVVLLWVSCLRGRARRASDREASDQYMLAQSSNVPP